MHCFLSDHVDDRGRVEASQISSGRPEHELGKYNVVRPSALVRIHKQCN